jgi:capsular polysaccharide biosynthesis protein
MELRQLMKALRYWWWLGAIPIAVVGLYLGLTYRAPATAYRIEMRFTTGSLPAETLSPDYDRYYAWLTSEYIANGLADLAVTGEFAQAVADRLAEEGITAAAGALQAAIVTDNAQSILVVYITWPSPAEAIAIAEAITEELVVNGPSYYPQMAGVGVVAYPVDPPSPIPLQPSLRARLLGPGVRLLLATAVGFGLVLLAHYIDPWVHEPSEVEALDVPVVGLVPRRRRWQRSLESRIDARHRG